MAVQSSTNATVGHRDVGGFTLIEVMTAFTILAIVAGLIFTVVSGSSRRSRALVRETELRGAAFAILNLLAEDLEGAFVSQGTGAFFVGTDGSAGHNPADEVKFITTSTLPLRPDEPAGDVAEVSYTLRVDDKGSASLFRREQTPISPPYDEGGVDVELSDRVTGLNMRYYDGRTWMDRWDSQDRTSAEMAGKIPRMVEIEVTMRRDEAASTVRTVVSPPLAVVPSF